MSCQNKFVLISLEYLILFKTKNNQKGRRLLSISESLHNLRVANVKNILTRLEFKIDKIAYIEL